MPLFDRKERKKRDEVAEVVQNYFNLINAYTPAFRTYDGGIYEMELTRAAIHCFANHCSKLSPQVLGSNNQQIERILQTKPNNLMDTKKYLYRLATITQVKNNAYIAPIYDRTFTEIIGFYPLHPDKCELKKIDGVTWLIYEFADGKKSAIEFDFIGRLNQFQNRSELFGESNAPMMPTLKLMDSQNQAIIEGVKSSASVRFLARLAQTLREEDVVKERDRFVKNNLSSRNGGVMMFDAKYADVKQIESRPFTIDSNQMQLIRENVFDYFGVSENILQNKYTADEWNAFYEGKIEPFALELGLVHTDMLFNDREKAFGNEVKFSANRMDYLGTGAKVSMIQVLFDRGLLTPNEAREILNMSLIKDESADKFYIRKEYTENKGEEENASEDGQTVQSNANASAESEG